DDALAPHDERRQILSRFLLRADPRRDLCAAHIHLRGIGGNVGLAIGRGGTGVRDRAVAGESAHRRISPRSIFSFSFRIPYISPSGVGGQPATQMSTGMTSSMPCITWYMR